MLMNAHHQLRQTANLPLIKIRSLGRKTLLGIYNSRKKTVKKQLNEVNNKTVTVKWFETWLHYYRSRISRSRREK
jgi:hypothetical protein